MIADDMMTFIKNDIIVFGLGVFIFIVATLWYVFRRLIWVIVPISSCFFSVIIMTGLLGLLGWKVTVISSNFILENIYFAKTNYNQTFLFWIVFAAISPSIIAFSLYTRLQKYVGASFAGFTLYLFAVYGSFFGIIIFEEPLLSFHYLGGLLVFTGVYFARKKV